MDLEITFTVQYMQTVEIDDAKWAKSINKIGEIEKLIDEDAATPFDREFVAIESSTDLSKFCENYGLKFTKEDEM